MSVREYSLQFNSLARYAPNVVATMEDRVHRFMDRLETYLVRDCTIAALNRDMDIARIQAFAQKMEDQRQRKGYMNLKEDSPKELDLWDSLWSPKENLDLECFLDRRDRHSLIPQ